MPAPESQESPERPQQTASPSEFERAAEGKQAGLLQELWSFVWESKKWWLTPILLVLLLLAAFVLFGGGSAAPFIYTLF